MTHNETSQQMDPDSERVWAILAHLSIVIFALASVGLGTFIGPLIIWFIFKDKSKLVRNAAAGAFNFSVSMWLIVVVGCLCFITVILAPLAIFLYLVVFVLCVWCPIRGAMQASKYRMYSYPFTFSLVN